MPRGLYGRAALILIVPIVSLQLVVSLAYLQRYFEDVTRQLTAGLAIDLRLVRDSLEGEGRAASMALAGHLDMDANEAPIPGWTGSQRVARRWYDLSGREVIATLQAMVPDIAWIDLAREATGG